MRPLLGEYRSCTHAAHWPSSSVKLNGYAVAKKIKLGTRGVVVGGGLNGVCVYVTVVGPNVKIRSRVKIIYLGPVWIFLDFWRYIVNSAEQNPNRNSVP